MYGLARQHLATTSLPGAASSLVIPTSTGCATIADLTFAFGDETATAPVTLMPAASLDTVPGHPDSSWEIRHLIWPTQLG